jgi:hypothetical protein
MAISMNRTGTQIYLRPWTVGNRGRVLLVIPPARAQVPHDCKRLSALGAYGSAHDNDLIPIDGQHLNATA